MIKRRIALAGGFAEATEGPNAMVRIGDRVVPKRIEATFPSVGGQPALTMSVEVIDGRPQCRELTISSTEGGREVKQLDLRAVEVSRFVEELFAVFAGQVVDESGGTVRVEYQNGPHTADASAVMQRSRTGRGARRITRGFLEEVAQVYRDHFDDNPTLAVAATFGVSHRQASNYRKKAEEAGLLPATTAGKKAR